MLKKVATVAGVTAGVGVLSVGAGLGLLLAYLMSDPYDIPDFWDLEEDEIYTLS